MSDEKKNLPKGKFLLYYVPSKWPSTTRFRNFNYNEYSINYQTSSLLRSIESRFEKIDLLWNHFNEIRKIQPKENDVAEREGYVNPIYSKLMTAIFEAILNEFYSINDNVAKILMNIFPKKNLPERMSKLIARVETYALPGTLTRVIMAYNTYKSLNAIRTESSHFSSGFIVPGDAICYFSDKSGPTTKSNGNAILIDDVEKFYTNQLTETSSFVDKIFAYLESSLTNNNRSIRICGVYGNLLYQRLESYMDWKTGREGVCTPIWKENTKADECPLAMSCKAYKNYLIENKIDQVS
ncbi:MAG: hypothetical protein OIN85_00470 [Candidatus Methanoperedens sp.]|nr:hypothetical protein [Candidatus Methanoperedens sp.]